MKRSLIAGAALVAGIAIASPMLASADSDKPPQSTQAAPARPGMPGMPGMGGMPGITSGVPGVMGSVPEMMRGHGGWMHRMMQLSPQQRCEERLARRAGRIAYMEAKLNLTPEQKPLADKLHGMQQAAADRERQICASLKPTGDGGQETILDKVNRREQLLAARLQGLQQIKPALAQLYQALTPEQKAIIDHPFRPG